MIINDFACRIKQLRKQLGLNQTNFAYEMGISMRGVQRWEKGEVTINEIKESSLRLIEQTFNVNPEWLREGEGEMFNDCSSSPQPRSSADALIMNALQHMDEEQKEDLLKYIEKERESARLRKENEELKKKLG